MRNYLPTDIVLSDERLLSIGFSDSRADADNISTSREAILDRSRALEILKNDPDLGALLLSSAPGNGAILWAGEGALALKERQMLGVCLYGRNGANGYDGDNLFGKFLSAVRSDYREYLHTNVPYEKPFREDQVTVDFTRKGATSSDIEERENDGMRYIHVDVYRPAKFRFDSSFDGTTGHAQRRSDAEVSFHKYECPFGVAYPAPVIVGTAAEASFLYEKALRKELDWSALADDLVARGLMAPMSKRLKDLFVNDYTAQFDWMREQICRDPELRHLKIVAPSLLVPDASMGRSQYDYDHAMSPAHVLAFYINNPVYLFSGSDYRVVKALGLPDKQEPEALNVMQARSLNVLVFGSDTIGGREAGRRATSTLETVEKINAQGEKVYSHRKKYVIPQKTREEVEKDYASFRARMDQILSGIPENTRVNLVTGGTSQYSSSVGPGTPHMLARYVREKGGAVLDYNYSSNRFHEHASLGYVATNPKLSVTLLEHFLDVYPVLVGGATKVGFNLEENDDDTYVSFANTDMVADVGVCFSVDEDTNNRNILALGSYAVAVDLPLLHIQENRTLSEQAEALREGAQKSLSAISGEVILDEPVLSADMQRQWQAEGSNVLSVHDADTGVYSPFVSERRDVSVVVGGVPYYSVFSAFVALCAVHAADNGQREQLLSHIREAEGSTQALSAIYSDIRRDAGLSLSDIERLMRQSVRLFSAADSVFAGVLRDLDARPIVEFSSFGGGDLFADGDGRGANYFGVVLTSEAAIMRDELARSVAEQNALAEKVAGEAVRMQKTMFGMKAEGEKVAGGMPSDPSLVSDAVWFCGTNSYLDHSLKDGNHSFEVWDDMGGVDPLVREKAARAYSEDTAGNRIPNDYIYLFPSDLQAVTGYRRPVGSPDSKDLTGVKRKGPDGKDFVCCFGIPVYKDFKGNELLNDQGFPCSFRLDNDASNFSKSVVLSLAQAVYACSAHGHDGNDLALSILGRTRADGSKYFPIGQVFMDQYYDRKDKTWKDNPHRSPLNLEIVNTMLAMLDSGKDYPLNMVFLPRSSYSESDIPKVMKKRLEKGEKVLSAEGCFEKDLRFSLEYAFAQAQMKGVKVRFPLDAENRIDLGPGVPERFRPLAENIIDSYLGTVKEKDIVNGPLPYIERIPIHESSTIDFQRTGVDIYIRPNDLVYAFGRYDFSYINSGQTAPLHEMVFRTGDGDYFKVVDAKTTRGAGSEVNDYVGYKLNDQRRFRIKASDPGKAGEFKSVLQGYMDRAKLVKVEMRLIGEKERGTENYDLNGFVNLMSSNSEEFARDEHDIGREMTAFNIANRMDGTDTDSVYFGKEDAKDGFMGYAQIRYILPDGSQSGWHKVEDLELAKDIVKSMVKRKYRMDEYTPLEPKTLETFATAEAVKYAGQAFRDCVPLGERSKTVVDDKIVTLESPAGPDYGEAASGAREVSAPAAAEAAAVPEPERAPMDASVIDFQVYSGGYRDRTYANANADDVNYTLAFAVDFSTGGERCTAKAAGDSLISVTMPLADGKLDSSPEAISKAVDKILSGLSEEFRNGTEGIGFNIAGNGIYTLSSKGISQEQTDAWITRVLDGISESGVKVSTLRTGGQTGVDEAGAVAGVVLGIPTTVLAPKGWEFRNSSGKDSFDEGAFKARFEGKDYKALAGMLDGKQKARRGNQKKIK